MGIVADTSVFTICERKRWTAKQVGLYLTSLYTSEQIVIPSVVAAELVHGIYRARTPEQQSKREAFVQSVLSSYTIAPFSEDAAWIAGRVRGEHIRAGDTLPLADSLIAATALEFGYSVLTHNVKDFVRISTLKVLPFNLP